MVNRMFWVAFFAMISMSLRAELITPQVPLPPQTSSLAATVLKAKDTKAVNSNNASNVIEKLNAISANTIRNFTQTGTASWYGRQFNDKKTTTGEKSNISAMTAAHPNLPLNCTIRVTNQSNGKSIIVKINAHGPFSNRILDLSYGAAQALDISDNGSAKVKIERMDN